MRSFFHGRAVFWLAATLLVACCFGPEAVFSQEEGNSASPPQQVAGQFRSRNVAPGATISLHDPAFDRYADVQLLRNAWAEMNPSLLADVGLQLAEGERVLQRPHKGITADEVLDLAVKMAAAKKDKATLDRLAKAADAHGDKGLADRVAAAEKQVEEAPRGLEPGLMVSVEQTSPEQFAQLHQLLADIRKASLAGDSKSLDQLQKQVSSLANLSPQQKDLLTQRIKAARDAAGKGPPNAVAKVLNDMKETSRDPGNLYNSEWQTTYGSLAKGGFQVNAHVVLQGYSGYYTTDDGSTGQLYQIAYAGSTIRGSWSFNGESGRFTFPVTPSGTNFEGTWTSNSGRSGYWYGQRASGSGNDSSDGTGNTSSNGNDSSNGTGNNSSNGTGNNSSNGTGNNSSNGTGNNSSNGTGNNSSNGTGNNSSNGTGNNSSNGAGNNSSNGTGNNSSNGAGYNSSNGNGPESP